MEGKIGEVFEYNGVKLITIEDKNNNGCKGCHFFNSGICTFVDSNHYLPCIPLCRNDNKNVIFKEVKRYGDKNN